MQGESLRKEIGKQHEIVHERQGSERERAKQRGQAPLEDALSLRTQINISRKMTHSDKDILRMVGRGGGSSERENKKIRKKERK